MVVASLTVADFALLTDVSSFIQPLIRVTLGSVLAFLVEWKPFLWGDALNSANIVLQDIAIITLIANIHTVAGGTVVAAINTFLDAKLVEELIWQAIWDHFAHVGGHTEELVFRGAFILADLSILLESKAEFAFFASSVVVISADFAVLNTFLALVVPAVIKLVNIAASSAGVCALVPLVLFMGASLFAFSILELKFIQARVAGVLILARSAAWLAVFAHSPVRVPVLAVITNNGLTRLSVLIEVGVILRALGDTLIANHVVVIGTSLASFTVLANSTAINAVFAQVEVLIQVLAFITVLYNTEQFLNIPFFILSRAKLDTFIVKVEIESWLADLAI